MLEGNVSQRAEAAREFAQRQQELAKKAGKKRIDVTNELKAREKRQISGGVIKNKKNGEGEIYTLEELA